MTEMLTEVEKQQLSDIGRKAAQFGNDFAGGKVDHAKLKSDPVAVLAGYGVEIHRDRKDEFIAGINTLLKQSFDENGLMLKANAGTCIACHAGLIAALGALVVLAIPIVATAVAGCIIVGIDSGVLEAAGVIAFLSTAEVAAALNITLGIIAASIPVVASYICQKHIKACP